MQMGFSLSWLAVRGKDPRVLLQQLGLRGTGELEEIPESEIVGAQLPGGWYVVVNDHDVRFVDDAVLERISVGCEAVTCFVEEHVMCSAATRWNDGKEVWAVIHNAQERLDHLIEEGAPPSELAAIRDELRAKKADGVDFIFDVPVELAGVLTGFRHDRVFPGASEEDQPFEVLMATKPSDTRRSSRLRQLYEGT
jgi:hypothetical protein